MLGTMQLRIAVDFEHMGSGAGNAGTHGGQHARQILYFWLARCVFDYRAAVGAHRGHHDVLGCADRRGVEPYARTLEPLSVRLDVAVTKLNFCTQRANSGDMQIDRAGSNRAASWGRYASTSTARQQRPEHDEGGSHRLD